MDSEISQLIPSQGSQVNLESQRRQRREFWWQILFPLLASVTLISFGAYWLLSQGGGSTESLSQIATMLLILPLLLIGLILLIAVGAVIYGVALVMKWLPPNAFWLQGQIQRVSHRVVQAADMLAEPVLRLDSLSSALRRVFRR